MGNALESFFEMANDTGTASPVLLIILAGAVFLAILAVLLAFFSSPDPLKRRLRTLELSQKRAAGMTPSIIPAQHSSSLWDRFSMVFLPQGDKARALNAERLKLAGYRSLSAMATYFAVRAGLMVLLPVLAFSLPAIVPGWQVREMVPYILLAFLLGMIGPSYFLDKKILHRQRLLRNALPDALDLLVVCTEAGLGLNAALVRLAREIRDIHPEFAAEMSMVNAEIGAGLDRDQALRNLVDRTGLDDIKALVVTMIQSLRFGTSIAETLRIYSEDFRDKRMQKAEEKAAQLGTKMMFPLIFCFMPAFFVVAVGPALLSLIKALSM